MDDLEIEMIIFQRNLNAMKIKNWTQWTLIEYLRT